MVDLAAESVDVAIRFGRGDFGRDLQIDLLTHESVTPVCSPKLAAEWTLTNKRDIGSFKLLDVARVE